MKRLIGAVVAAFALLVFAVPAFADATLVPDAIWANGILYGTVATPTHGLADSGPFEPIYNFAGGGLLGQRSIAPAGPGDPGFYGGRWEVHFARFTASGIAYYGDGAGHIQAGMELMSQSDLNWAVGQGYVTISSTVADRFVCTLVPGK